jgi:TonB family protein
MSILNTIVKPESRLLSPPRKSARTDTRQRELMVGSLCLLLLALSIVLWHDRDFWFPDTVDEAETDQPVQSAPVAIPAPKRETTAVTAESPVAKPVHKAAHATAKVATAETTVAAAPQPSGPVISTTSRTVLPPLEVEVVAGDTHRVVRPGNNSLHVDLQPGAPAQAAVDVDTRPDTDTAATVTSNAAEHVQMSPDASAIVTSPVKPNYPLLARQMKVQGSVILQALIGRDGIIQNLRVISGPHILASAAEYAVRQWHFKPHYEGSEAVETQAKITVNFTISTN